MLGGLLRFKVEGTVRDGSEGVSMSATTVDSMGLVRQREGGRERERGRL